MFKNLFGKKAHAIPKVRLMGMNERALNLFTMFLEGPARGMCEIVDDGSHQIVIIDLDAVENARLWLDMRSQFNGPAIVLSVSERDLSNAFWLAKPVKPEQFKLAMDKAKKAIGAPSAPVVAPRSFESAPPTQAQPKTEHKKPEPAKPVVEAAPVSPQPKATTVTSVAAGGMNESLDERAQNCCGDLPDDVYLDVTQRGKLFVDGGQSLVTLFREAMRLTAESGVVNFVGLSIHPFYVSAADDFVSTPMPEALLRSSCVRSAQSVPVKLELVDKKPNEIGLSDDQRLRRLDNVLWKLALWSSRGRVEVGTSLDAPVRLRAWPNIPCLMSVPHCLRIAALWVTQPTGLLDTGRKLGVPYRYVFSFYCACKAFDLVETLGSAAQSNVNHEPAKAMTQEKRSLFGSLLKKLGF
jgi:hypothetical protein